MNVCHKQRTTLTAYALGELDRRAQDRVEVHLAECEGCRSEVEALSRDMPRIAEALRCSMAAPDSLMVRFEAELSRMRSTGRTHWFGAMPRWAWFLPVLAVLVVVALLKLPTAPGEDGFAIAFREYPALAASPNPGTIPSKSPLQAAAMLEADVGFRVQPPRWLPDGFRFVGARRCTFRSFPAALLVYERNGVRVLVYQAPQGTVDLKPSDRVATERIEIYCCSHGDTSAVAWNSGKHTFLVVSKFPAGELAKLRSVYAPRAVILPLDVKAMTTLGRTSPFLASLATKDGRLTVYVCQNFVCQLPTTDVDAAVASFSRSVSPRVTAEKALRR